MFDGLRVLDLSARYAGALAAMFLADMGAQVVRLADLASDAPAFAHRNKTLLEGALDRATLEGLAQHADVIIEDAPIDRLIFGPQALPNSQGVVHLWMPSFGADDPLLAKMDCPEGALEAACGMHEVPVGLKPRYSDLSILAVSSAAYGLNGVLAALYARRRDGLGQRVVLPRADVAYAVLELNGLFTQSPPKAWATLQWASTPFISAYQCADGRYLYVHAGLDRHLARLLDAFDELAAAYSPKLRAILSEQTLEDPTSVPNTHEHKQILEALSQLFFLHPAQLWQERLSERGLCAVVALTHEQWLTHEHALESGQIVEVDGQRCPGRLVELGFGSSADAPLLALKREQDAQALLARWASMDSPAKPEVAADTQDAPLVGLRVLDMTQVIAGPVAARTLAELGAQVLRVENPHFKAPWVEPFHIAYNAGKASVMVDLKTAQGLAQFWQIVDEFKPDVLVHNLRPGAFEALGVTKDELRARLPKLRYVHLNAYGQRGPWSLRPGWEQTAQAACGVQMAYGHGRPELFPLPMTDLATGLFGAAGALCALLYDDEAAAQDGLLESYACLSATATLLMSIDRLSPHPRRDIAHPELGRRPMHRFYKARDGWLFLSVAPGDERALLKVLGLEHIPAYSGRLRERALERTFLEEDVQEWVSRVLRAGAQGRVCIVPRRTQRETFKSERAHRLGLVHVREHAGLGRLHETGSALALSRTPGVTLGPASPRTLGSGDDAQKARPDTISWIKQQATGAVALWLNKRR